MKPRYNLRLSSNNKIHSSHVTRKSMVRRLNPTANRATRRHSLRLNPTIKKVQTRSNIPNSSKPRKIENEPIEEPSSTKDVDNYDDLLVRHRRRMLEEQKDRKLYERYVRDQRTLRRLQCRRTHTAHLTETTRNRLLRELERERRYTVHDQICAHLANHTFLFRHKYQLHSNQPMDWTLLEEELPRSSNQETIRQLDVMINNLKKVTHPSKSNTSKPRLSVHERQKQRLAANSTDSPVLSSHPHSSLSNEIQSHSHTINNSTHSILPTVRFVDHENFHLPHKTNNPHHLICIQNVLSPNNHYTTRLTANETSTSMSIRRPKTNLAESSTSKKRPLEKENCSLVTSTTPSNIVLRAMSPMISIKSSGATSNYRNARKIQALVTRRRERSAA